MTLSSSNHPVDEDLQLFADGLTPDSVSRRVAAHLILCTSCSSAVEEARRGLTTLTLVAEPPAHLEQVARARKWAASRSEDPMNLRSETETGMREVVGRELESEPEGQQRDE
jgi:anti-sigma factor RsiW